jgi:murein DD-endopeptidase MepM/ murein hydrolase activator NlpD
MIMGLMAAGYFSYGYYKLSQERNQLQLLRSTQKIEIDAFAKKMQTLQMRISELEELETMIRIQADLETDQKIATTFGIGGSSGKGTPERYGVGGVTFDAPDLTLDIGKESDQIQLSALHRKASALVAAVDLKTNDFKILLKGLEIKSSNEAAAIPSLYPVEGGRVTSRYGYRRDPYTNRREFHRGYDIGAPRGAPIKVTADGTVTFSGRNGAFGKMLTIKHKHGYETRYAHADKLLVKKGAMVRKGDVVALVGSSGRSTGPHLHYEVRKNGMSLNPKGFFTVKSKKKKNNLKVAYISKKKVAHTSKKQKKIRKVSLNPLEVRNRN